MLRCMEITYLFLLKTFLVFPPLVCFANWSLVSPVPLVSRDRVLKLLIVTTMGVLRDKIELVLRNQWLLPPVTRQVTPGIFRRGQQRNEKKKEGGRVGVVISLSPRFRSSYRKARGGRLYFVAYSLYSLLSGSPVANLVCRPRNILPGRHTRGGREICRTQFTGRCLVAHVFVTVSLLVLARGRRQMSFYF